MPRTVTMAPEVPATETGTDWTKQDEDAMILACIHLVRPQAWRIFQTLPGGTVTLDELISVGNYGLVHSARMFGSYCTARNFDPRESDGSYARAYASRRITGSMLDHLRSLDHASRSARQRARRCWTVRALRTSASPSSRPTRLSSSAATGRSRWRPWLSQAAPEKVYRYIEINDVSVGAYRWQSLRGWELPSRGKHHAEPDDIYIGSIWSCVSKWFLAPRNSTDMIVTNGFLRLRLLPGNSCAGAP